MTLERNKTNLFSLPSVCCAIPLKRDDTPQLKAEGEKFVQDKLEEFREAASNSQNLKPYFNDLLNYIQKAQKNNEKLTKGIKFIVNHMQSIISHGVNFIAIRRLHAFTATIDGNRDNVSYYVLDYSAKWIEQRLASVSGELEQNLIAIKQDIETARDALDANAQEFVNGVKNIKSWTAPTLSGGADHASEIANVIARLNQGVQDETLVNKTNEAVISISNISN